MSRSLHRILVAVTLFPLAAYLLLFSWNVWREGWITFGRLDLLVLLSVAAYALLAIWAMRDSRRLGRIAIITSILLAGVVLGEGVARWFTLRPIVNNYPWPPMSRAFHLAADLPGLARTGTFSVNELGVRGPRLSSESREGILCIGGSATECLYVNDEESWPWRMGTALANHDSDLFVGNAGRSGHMTRHHAYLIEHYDGIGRFPWLVVMCGVNDMGALLHCDRGARIARVPLETLFHHHRPNEAFHRRTTLWRLMERTLDVGTPVAGNQIFQDAEGKWILAARQARQHALQTNPIDEPPADLDQALSYYRDDLHAIIDAARRQSRFLVLVTQPALWHPDLSEELQSLLWEHVGESAYTHSALAEILAGYNQTLKDVCRATDTPCIDLASMLPRDTSVFYDDCHFNIEGCEKVAQIVGAFFDQHALSQTTAAVAQ